MNTKSTVILAAKPLSDTSFFQDQMFPVRSKPAIAWVIEEHLPSNELIVVVNKENTTTLNYIEKSYPNITLVKIDEQQELESFGIFSILNSLSSALSYVHSQCVQIVLGDTIVRKNNSTYDDIILVSEDFSTSERWCLVDVDNDNYALQFYDKAKDIDTSGMFALVGFYQFSRVDILKKCVMKALSEKQTRMSDVLKRYQAQHPIKCEKAVVWFDLGHKAGLLKAQNTFFNSRDFNTIQTNPVLGTITKTSNKIQKIFDEYTWYNNLPPDLKVIAPRTISFEENICSANLTMEMYGYPTLSELYLFGSLSYEEWKLIITKTFEVHAILKSNKGVLSEENFKSLYYNKSLSRLKELTTQDKLWYELLNYDTIIINNKTYKNIKHYKKRLLKYARLLYRNVDVSIMHGDYCFSNILFDTHSFFCRLIDPRGRLDVQTIYGDPRYDVAKLRHSVVGCYDFAVHGLFSLEEDDNSFKLNTGSPPFYEKLTKFFDEQVVKYGYNLFEIKLIEAALFLTMIPLHKDNMQRQKFFYLKAVIKLNDLFGGEYD